MKKIIIILSVFSLVLMNCSKQDQYKTKASEIFPPHELLTVALFRMNDLNIASSYFSGKWTTVLLGHAPCDDTCMTSLKMLNDVTKGQNLFVFDDIASTVRIKTLTDTFKNVTISMGVTATSTDFFLAHFDIEGIEAANKNNHFYLINPDGAVAYSLAIDSVDSVVIEKEIMVLIDESR